MPSIAISAYSGPPRDIHVERSKIILETLIDFFREEKRIWFLGGYRGLMREVTDTLLSLNEKLVMILPLEYEEEQMPEDIVKVKTGMTYPNRNVVMVRSGDMLVALGGGAGSMMEVVTGVEIGKTVFLMIDTGLPTDMLARCAEKPILDHRKKGRLYVFRDESELREKLEEALPGSRAPST